MPRRASCGGCEGGGPKTVSNLVKSWRPSVDKTAPATSNVFCAPFPQCRYFFIAPPHLPAICLKRRSWLWPAAGGTGCSLGQGCCCGQVCLLLLFCWFFSLWPAPRICADTAQERTVPTIPVDTTLDANVHHRQKPRVPRGIVGLRSFEKRKTSVSMPLSHLWHKMRWSRELRSRQSACAPKSP